MEKRLVRYTAIEAISCSSSVHLSSVMKSDDFISQLNAEVHTIQGELCVAIHHGVDCGNMIYNEQPSHVS